MGYSNGIATNQNDLLDSFRSFASGEGWTVNSYATDSSNYDTRASSSYYPPGTPARTAGARLHISKNGMYFNFRSGYGQAVFDWGKLGFGSDSNDHLWGIAVNGSTGYSAGASWENQPGAPTISGSGIGAQLIGIADWSVNYWFFSTTETLTMVVEYDPVNYPGYLQQIHVGRLRPSGDHTFTGAEGMIFAAPVEMQYSWSDEAPDATAFYNAMNNTRVGCLAHRTDGYGKGGVYMPTINKAVGSNPAGWYQLGQSGNSNLAADLHAVPHGCPAKTYSGMVANMMRRTPNSETGVTPFFPVYITIMEDGQSQTRPYILAGTCEGIRVASHDGYTLGQQDTIGSDDWRVFPVWHKAQETRAGFACIE